LNYNFEWDPLKARKNYQKHKISFERASEIFLDPIALSIYDKEHSITEDRWITIGKTKSEIIISSCSYVSRNSRRQYSY